MLLEERLPERSENALSKSAAWTSVPRMHLLAVMMLMECLRSITRSQCWRRRCDGSAEVMFPGVLYALLAGFLGAVASSSAKLSLGTDYLKGVCETGLRTWGEQRKFAQHNDTSACDWVSVTESLPELNKTPQTPSSPGFTLHCTFNA